MRGPRSHVSIGMNVSLFKGTGDQVVERTFSRRSVDTKRGAGYVTYLETDRFCTYTWLIGLEAHVFR